MIGRAEELEGDEEVGRGKSGRYGGEPRGNVDEKDAGAIVVQAES